MKALITALILLLTAVPALAQVQPLAAWWIDTGETDSTSLGYHLAPLGDINSDGLADFIVSAGGRELRVYLGNTQPDTVPDILIHRPDSLLKHFGSGLYSVGDVNGDGYPDFIAGAEKPILPTIRRYAFLYFGGPAFDTLPDLSLVGDPTSLSQFATWPTEPLGDVNGDGYDDFALTDQYYQVNGSSTILGAIYLYYGGSQLDSIPDVVIHADSTLNRIGMRVAPLGDVNGDGYADWVMCHPQCRGPNGEADVGVVALYHGGNPPDTLPYLVMYGPVGENLGKSLTTFDWNGDGQVDIFAGNGITYLSTHYGSVWEYNVSPAMTGQPDHVFLGVSYSTLGWLLWHVDLNGDGRQDLVDGEPGYSMSGLVYVFLNGTYSDTLYDATYVQGNSTAYLGAAGCNAGDTNGDGIEDMAVDETYHGYGRVHLILGSDSLHQSGVEPTPPPAIPQTAALLKAYPNPFNGQVVLEISAPSPKDNHLQIYNLSGQEVRRFSLSYGQRRAVWDGRSASGQKCATGIYLAKLTGASYQVTQKVVLVR